MVSFNLTFDLNVSLEQRIGFTLAAALYEKLLTDTTTVNFHISATDTLDNNKAVGGAVPIFHEVHYGVYQEYLALDASSDADDAVLGALQKGNTVDFWVDDQRVDGNTTIMLTRAQAKALGMTEALALEDGNLWTRDVLQDPDALDGYILINNSYDWSYDVTRETAAAPNTLDFLTMALHELGHGIGFVSGLDGLIETFKLHSGETRTEGFTALDLLRYSETSATIENPDGNVSDLSVGGASYFSLDGGKTAIAEFEEGDEYQASHWQRSQNALGIMDPTLGYQERTSITDLDLQAFDALGWDINDAADPSGLDLNALYNESLQRISEDFGVGVEAVETAIANNQDWYTLGYSSWWEAFQDQIIELGYGRWWQEFEEKVLELGYSRWWQAFDQPMTELGYGRWWQAFEETVLELGYGRWWQEFEGTLTELGYGRWWQAFELGYGRWWQELETHTPRLHDSGLEAGVEAPVNHTQSDQNSNVQGPGGSADTILAGDGGHDFMSGSLGDDVIDGGGGDDLILGGAGNDIVYGFHGSDVLYGGEGDDFLTGENDDDRLYGEADHDRLMGGGGDDTLDGGEGRDVLKGDIGRDRLIGGHGQDLLHGGEGDDTLYGDAYVLINLPIEETTSDTTAENRLFQETTSDQEGLASDEQAHHQMVGFQVSLDDGDVLDIQGWGDREDQAQGDQAQGDQAQGDRAQHDDTLRGGLGHDVLYGGEGNDTLYGEDENNQSGGGDDRLYGGDGHDVLYGNSGDDRLNGTEEFVAGASELDILTGGGGSDRFILGDPHQSYYIAQGIEDYATVTDFNPLLDVIQLHGSIEFYQQEQQGQDVWLRHGGDLIAIFQETDSLSLASSTVEFV